MAFWYNEKNQDLNIVDKTWSLDKHILKPFLMVHNNFYLNIVAFWFEGVLTNCKNLGLCLMQTDLHNINGAMN
jgi:hypothetical protein